MKSLIGKTIKSVTYKGHDKNCISKNVLRITMTDGSVFEIEGSYGSYYSGVCDEYIEVISVGQVK